MIFSNVLSLIVTAGLAFISMMVLSILWMILSLDATGDSNLQGRYWFFYKRVSPVAVEILASLSASAIGLFLLSNPTHLLDAWPVGVGIVLNLSLQLVYSQFLAPQRWADGTPAPPKNSLRETLTIYVLRLAGASAGFTLVVLAYV